MGRVIRVQSYNLQYSPYAHDLFTISDSPTYASVSNQDTSKDDELDKIALGLFSMLDTADLYPIVRIFEPGDISENIAY